MASELSALDADGGFQRSLAAAVGQSIGALTISRHVETDYQTPTRVSAASTLFASMGRRLPSLALR